MQEASGLIQDSSGNARHATGSSGTPTYHQSSPIASDPSDFSILFAAEWFSVPHTGGLNMGNVWTLECWVKCLAPTTTAYVCFGKGTNAYGCFVKETTNTFVGDAEGQTDLAHSSVTVVNNQWRHCVATKNGATSLIYVDGVDRTVADIDFTTANNGTALRIGDSPFTGNPFVGGLDEVAIYPTALSAARVLAHYTAASNPSTASVAWL